VTAPGHVSALLLDALALGALDGDAAARVRAHLASCAECRSDHEAAAELRAQFSRLVLPRTLPVRRPRRWVWLAAPALAALCVILALRLRQPPVPELAIKGDASWEVFANRAGRVFAVHDGTRLAEGDRIRFAIVPGGARYLLVASVDGGGGVTMYYPYNGVQSVSITDGEGGDGGRIEPPGSIVLDAAPGPERIYAMLSDVALPVELVTTLLQAVAGGGADAIRATRTLPLPVRAQLSLVFEKAGP
jgi:hypothetical protein